ncbi:MAG: UvrD-helicase domain-containing protein [Coriobacteriales bacterium]|jgi:DNA helicase-2/ATP-dependent DNA helicase PcrA|nr:UvrD-helicase domain-containing protein [Coriobacteriales bacterium]
MPLELSGLNSEQSAAVLCTQGPLLVLAGAGSGKTRVLTYRIAHLIEDLGVSPYQILAITFTNKAAAEMRERLGRLLAHGMRGMWVATFHAMCVRMLRQDAEQLGYSRDFTIYDDDDSRRLVKAIFTELNIDTKQFPLNGVRERISKAKNELLNASDYEAQASNGFERLVARVYQLLQTRLKRADAMDFDDLLMNTWLVLSRNPEILTSYQNRFRYLLVDEYQDTNRAQYAITHLLAAGHHNIMVVGDDDQSIYSWRGADLRNILEFERDYPEATVIKLEQNYRSTQTILEAANAVIAHNEQRKPKRLFTEGDKGERIALYQATDERDEGRWIASEVERLRKLGRPYRSFAVFYRTNAQSRILEDMLLRAGVPYRIVGGTRFFDRAEIRDVMAYLKLVVNPADEIAAKRVINVPKRGIGKTSVEKIDEIAHREGCTFLEAVELALLEGGFGKKTLDAMAQFVQMIREARGYTGELRNIVEMLVAKSGLIDALQAEHTDEARGRIENIQEFFGVAQEFEQTHQPEDDLVIDEPDSAIRVSSSGLQPAESSLTHSDPDTEPVAQAAAQPDTEPAAPLLVRFMEWLALRSDLDSIIADDDYLTLMTIHSAKGLEFPIVFIAGLEESLFPHSASADNPAGLEEERRLAYVAITRARELLFLTYAQVRNLFGNTQANPSSRFVAEIPTEHLKSSGVGSADYLGVGWEKRGDRHGIFGSGTLRERDDGRVFGAGGGALGTVDATGTTGAARTRGTRGEDDALKREREATCFTTGDEVDHKTFGRGVIVEVDGDALLIRFSKLGETKKLLKGYAPIVKLG